MNSLRIFAVLVPFLLTGCAVQRAEVAARAQKNLVGMSKAELLSCAGVPLRQDRAEGLEFLTYAGGGDVVSQAVVTQTSPSNGVASGKSARRYCEATFVLRDGRVERVNYQGRTGGLLTKGEQCAFIVESCLKQ
jgi:hypothetical protein